MVSKHDAKHAIREIKSIWYYEATIKELNNELRELDMKLSARGYKSPMNFQRIKIPKKRYNESTKSYEVVGFEDARYKAPTNKIKSPPSYIAIFEEQDSIRERIRYITPILEKAKKYYRDLIDNSDEKEFIEDFFMNMMSYDRLKEKYNYSHPYQHMIHLIQMNIAEIL